MDGDGFLYIYLGVVLGAGVLLLVRVTIGLNRTRLARLSRLADKRKFEAVPTGTPVEDPVTLARARAHRSIDQQFTVTRRFVVPMIVLFVGAACSLPFLQDAPANLVSLFVTVMTVFAGVAARPYLENAMAGLVISSSRLVNLGDTVKLDDLYGTVEDITTTHTTIKLWDWRRYVVPNAKMLQSNFLNYSLYDRYIWATVEIHLSYEVDLPHVRELAIEAAASSEYFAGAEPPDFWVMELGRDNIRCILAAWADMPSTAWSLATDARLRIADAFRREGIRAHLEHLDVGTRPYPMGPRLAAQNEGSGKAGPGFAKR